MFAIRSFCLLALIDVSLGLQLGTAKVAAQDESHALVAAELGDLPILLSAPHGGSAPVPNVPVREGINVDRFKFRTDTRTGLLAAKLANALETELGKRPYSVVARFQRRYIDANRPPKLAYESEQAKPVYDAYHAALANARQSIVERWGRGLLIDIHGQASLPRSIVRGTQNGQTTKHLIARFGRESLVGRTSLFGRIAEQGFAVVPPVDSDDLEHPNYDGGHIVVRYGSRTDGSLDAIQLEVGKDLRSLAQIDDTAGKLAIAIAGFAREYLPTAERNQSQTRPVRVGVYHDEGVGRSYNDLLTALSSFDKLAVQPLTADDIRGGKLSRVDVLIQPGGSGSKQGRHLAEAGREKIRDFVHEGGGFIGICAGSYLASADYSWSLNILDAKVVDRAHWARGTGLVDIALTDEGRSLLDVDQKQLSIYYGQGPLLAPANKDEIPDYEVIASYESEIAEKGAPSGVMIGTTAIAHGRFGQGHVICFSPHPEMTDGLKALLKEAIDQVK